MNDRYPFILQTIQEAGVLLLSLRQEKFEVSTKGGDPRDLVTTVDLAIDNFIKSKIKEKFGDESIYSEESKEQINPVGSFWSIDPIDGTSNFVRGIPHFAVCLTYLNGYEPLMGAVYNPVTKDLFSFQKGSGAFLNSRKIFVSTISRINDAYVLLHIGRREELRDWGIKLQCFLLGAAKKNINLGSSALDLCFLAAGRVDAVIYGSLTTLDVAVALGLVREAGGEIYTLQGKPVSLSSKPQTILASTSRVLFEEINRGSCSI